MRRVLANALKNFCLTNFTNSFNVRPLVATYHFTHRCNLRCVFCEECGIERNAAWEAKGELSTADAKKLLRMLSTPFALLYITGGEPFLRTDVVELFDEIARLPFKNVSVNTNLTLMDRVERCLHAIDNLVVSIDSIDPERFDAIRGVKGMGARVLANLERIQSLQTTRKFRLHVNCVVTPATIDDARGVLEYCSARGLKVGINAQNDRHGPIKELMGDTRFKELIALVMRIKKERGNINGTKMYYDQMFAFQPYRCYPFITPRINAAGELAYPCDNLNQWVPNILDLGDWKAILRRAKEMYGPLTECDRACQFQCYIEPSKIAKRPWIALKEYC